MTTKTNIEAVALSDERPDPTDIQGWSVTVNVNAQDILTIGHNSLSGIDNIEDFAPVVRNCAEHLISFIGAAPASPSGEDAAEQSADPMAVVPAGFALVPVTPTQAMLDAGYWPCTQGRGAKSVWGEMMRVATGLKPSDSAPLPRASEQADEALPQIKPRLLSQLRRFNECCEDSEADGHDVDKEDMHSLAELGAVRPAPGGRHYMTDFGHYLLAARAKDSK